MKRTKKIGNIIILTVLTVVLLFYLLPNVALIEQSLEIKTPPDKVFELINRPENWAEWYKPLKDTSGIKLRFIGTSAGKGAGMKWVSHDPDHSTGIMNIRNSKNNRAVTAVVTINDKRSSVMNFKIKPVGTDASMLSITSRLRFRQDSLWHYLRLMFDRSDEQEIIDYLENIDDAAMEHTGGIDVLLQRVESFSYIGIMDSCSLEDVPQRINDLYNELLILGVRAGVDITARPVAIYHRLDEKNSVFELGIPVVEVAAPVSERIRYKTMPGRDHAVANYYGSYDTLEDGHNAIQQWLMRYRRKLAGYPWEMFVTDPTTESDPNKWLTRIYYPVD
jgi:effector-binding domain-containing protein